MSLLFKHAIDAFDVAAADFSVPDADELEPARDDPLPVEVIVEYASHHDGLRHPERDDWVCLPLHEREDAQLTDRYLAYADHAVHGRIVIYRQGKADGADEDFLGLEEFSKTPLAERLRFWHSDFVPEVSPDYYDSPLAEREPPRRSLDNPDALFDDLASLVRSEREAQRRANRERLPAESGALSSGDGVIPSLTSFGPPREGTYRFRVDEEGIDARDGRWAIQDAFSLFAGNEVRLYPPSADHAPDSFPIEAEIATIEGRALELAIRWETVDDRSRTGSYLRKKRRGWAVALVCNPVPFERELAGIEAVRDHPVHREVFTGGRALTFGDTVGIESTDHDEQLNQEQRLAVEHALLADELFCIHGPPGTGKTRTLVEIVRRTVETGGDVLVCADSNQAVDNLAAGDSTDDRADDRSLHAYAQHGTGEFVLERVNASRSSNPIVSRRYADVAERADVVASTNSSAARLARTFDVVVIDEATQATAATSCIPIARAEKVILAGDHRQLPPYSATEDPPDTAAGRSLFEHLYADGGVYEGVGVQLRTQYRMHRDVASFPNRTFYDGTLRHGRSVQPLEGRPAIEGFDIGGSEQTRGTSVANDTEIRLVCHLVSDLLEAQDLEAEDVGVIAPYTAQASAIERSLRERLETGGEAITVDTIDSFQGSEKAAIVISFVRSNDEGAIGFLGRSPDGPRRLNVAMTRAQRYCALVGDWYTLRFDGRGEDATPRQPFADLHAYLEDTGRLRRVDPALLPT